MAYANSADPDQIAPEKLLVTDRASEHCLPFHQMFYEVNAYCDKKIVKKGWHKVFSILRFTIVQIVVFLYVSIKHSESILIFHKINPTLRIKEV